MESKDDFPKEVSEALFIILGSLEVWYDSEGGLICSEAPKVAVFRQIEFALGWYEKILPHLEGMHCMALKRDCLILGAALHVLKDIDLEKSPVLFQKLWNETVEALAELEQHLINKSATWAVPGNLSKLLNK